MSGIGVGSGIGAALFPKIRRKALALFLLNPEKQFYFRQVVRLLGDTPGSVQRELKSLTEVGILLMEPIGIHKFYRANSTCPVFGELRTIAERTFGIADVIRDVLRGQNEGRIDSAWIYGSIASAHDTGSSDIDVMVIGSLTFRDLVSVLKPIEEIMQRTMSPNLYSKEEFLKRVREKNNFMRNVMDSEKLFVVGGQDDLDRLVE